MEHKNSKQEEYRFSIEYYIFREGDNLIVFRYMSKPVLSWAHFGTICETTAGKSRRKNSPRQHSAA